MRYILTFIVSTLFCMTLSHASNNMLVLNMKERVTVDTSNVRLIDVVNSISGDIEIINKVKDKIVLKLGNTVQYKKANQDFITSIIRNEEKNVNIIFSGSLNTIVKVKTQLYALNDIVDDVVNNVSQNISLISDEYSVRYLGNRDAFSIPSGNVSYEYELPDFLLKKRISVWADIYVDSIHYQSIPLWFDVTVIADVPVASKKLSVGQKIDDSNMAIQKRDVTLSNSDFIDKTKIGNFRVKKTLRSGEVLTYSMFESIPPVYKGQSVKVIASHGNVSILVTGFSLDDGEVGQSVRVKRLGSSRVFNAVVKQQGLVTAVGSS